LIFFRGISNPDGGGNRGGHCDCHPAGGNHCHLPQAGAGGNIDICIRGGWQQNYGSIIAKIAKAPYTCLVDVNHGQSLAPTVARDQMFTNGAKQNAPKYYKVNLMQFILSMQCINLH